MSKCTIIHTIILDYKRTQLVPEKFGTDIEIFHNYHVPLEWKCNHERPQTACYIKIICDRTKDNKVIGLHILGPNCGEILQGFALAFKVGFTKEQLDETVGIHPTCAEHLTSLTIPKKDGVELEGPAGC